MLIQPMIRNNICLNAHPEGCAKEVHEQIEFAQQHMQKHDALHNVLVLGCSTGYGLSSAIMAQYGYHTQVFGVYYERPPSEKKTATMGWYNMRQLEKEAQANDLSLHLFNEDAFSDETKELVCAAIAQSGVKIDLIIYSLATPVRTVPRTQIQAHSVLKPIGESFHSQTVDVMRGELKPVVIEPATEQEIEETIIVMGGDDWKLWIDALQKHDLLADGVKTVAYSYIGPQLTFPIYRDGTIGRAKHDLEVCARDLNSVLKPQNGAAYVSVQKALLTRASAVIPVVPLYVSMLFKIMKAKGLHEGCIEQIYRLFSLRLYIRGHEVPVDKQKRIRLDDWEMRADIQSEVEALWNSVTNENVEQICDLEIYRTEFLRLHGFGRTDIDYTADISPL